MSVVDQVVAVIRMLNGDELLAILCSENDGIIKVQHPHYVRISHENKSLAIIPYCILSDETYYPIRLDQVQFVATASDDIATKFISMIESPEEPEPIVDPNVVGSQLLH